MTNRSYIIAAKRSPVAPRDGALSQLSLHELSTPVIEALFDATNIKATNVNELIAGNALGAGGNPARSIALAAGLNESVAGLSIDRQCSSGLDAILLASDMIFSGRASVVIAGGVESYSQRPARFSKVKGGDELQPYDQPPFTPWPDRDPNMAEAADALATTLGITQQQQNDWTIQSHAKAMQAAANNPTDIAAGYSINNDSYTRTLNQKLCERAATIHGSVSVANTSVAADGAAYCMVVNEEVAAKHDGPKLLIRSGATLGADSMLPGIAPLAAINKVLNDKGVAPNQLKRAEIMEAYAAQAIACIEQSKLDASICNVGGGSLARGHPIAASGAILVARLFSELQTTPGNGLAAIAAAGGLGTALLVQSA